MNIEEMKKNFINNNLEKGVFTSINENKENLVVEVGTDFFSIETYQKNGWVRKNTYSYDKERWIEEELYDDRWDIN